MTALKHRCPTCGARVASIFDHIDRDCENDEVRRKLADAIDLQSTDPSVPPRWDDFTDDEWKLVAATLRAGVAGER